MRCAVCGVCSRLYYADSVVWLWCFFFFKQKTAYEMRISDWSSECALPILVFLVTNRPHSNQTAVGQRSQFTLHRPRATGRQADQFVRIKATCGLAIQNTQHPLLGARKERIGKAV